MKDILGRSAIGGANVEEFDFLWSVWVSSTFSMNRERFGDIVGSSAGIRFMIGLTGVDGGGWVKEFEFIGNVEGVLLSVSSDSPTEVADEQFDKGFSAILTIV